MVGQNHPTIWKLITKIRYEIAADREKLALNELGEAQPGEQSIKRKNGNKIKCIMHSFCGK
ncbi:Uncharacterized protein FWK35_00005641 [Aphis craccivora]|uniref:Uncharacterized protein n=1 Tax=Aphis craccivora TaxID=307492 RepID=A0A6G0Z4N2_APHCR|nr:Uncharacterized protein FWK35_00005641 [Aphis craccivora]